MKLIMNYIDESLKDTEDCKDLSDFRLNLITELTERANDITHAGIDDDKVIADIIISEHPDIAGEYNELINKNNNIKKARHNRKVRISAYLLYIVSVISAYFTVSVVTGAWSKTWAYLVSAFLIMFYTIIISRVKAFTKRGPLFHAMARILLCAGVFLLSASAFLILLVSSVPHSFLAFIVGVLLAMTADGIYAEKVSERFAIIFHLLYILPASAMFYIIFGITGLIAWSKGWIMIPMSLIIVFAVILIRLHIHSKADKSQETEDDAEWKEN